ncbi:hypothetical protein [Nonomuraea turkmeniaca]|uniref:hypothetical protein n=1 Tax=Nonomuraea turkmeniaca TaxID=103838 RepID=UPI001B87DA1F|nr:hypothetical protein [Nonomuraea turkmeniaca]
MPRLTWIDPVSWQFQVMPIFFLVGGYAGGASMASHRASGGDSLSWVLRRTDRLLRPTTAPFLVLPLMSVVAMAAGVSSDVGVGGMSEPVHQLPGGGPALPVWVVAKRVSVHWNAGAHVIPQRF